MVREKSSRLRWQARPRAPFACTSRVKKSRGTTAARFKSSMVAVPGSCTVYSFPLCLTCTKAPRARDFGTMKTGSFSATQRTRLQLTKAYRNRQLWSVAHRWLSLRLTMQFKKQVCPPTDFFWTASHGTSVIELRMTLKRGMKLMPTRCLRLLSTDAPRGGETAKPQQLSSSCSKSASVLASILPATTAASAVASSRGGSRCSLVILIPEPCCRRQLRERLLHTPCRCCRGGRCLLLLVPARPAC